MRAAVLAVGDELLKNDRVDTNSLELASRLERYGVQLVRKEVVGDNRKEIARTIARLVSDVELLVVTGGLGPTQDDLTREAIADALGLELQRDSEIVEQLRRRFARYGMEMPEVNEKQGDILAGAEALDNRRGTAPGQRIEYRGSTVFVFPGVPVEMNGLCDRYLEPWLQERSEGNGSEIAVFRLACVGESAVEERLQPYYERWGEEGVALLASPGEVTVRLATGGGEEQRRLWLSPRKRALREALGEDIFTATAGESLEAVTGGLLASNGLTIATAESCTGGLIAERLTRVAGSSAYFLGAIVSYANDAKTNLLGVGEEVMDRSGAVSEPVARAMVRGVRDRLQTDLSVAVTGIAGPGGGSEEKPVGTVHIAWCWDDGTTEHRCLRLPGDRERVRWLTSQWALNGVRRHLLTLV